jgi:hypothetical protein
VTGDKAQAGDKYALDNNVNTRDQTRALIWLIVLSLMSVGFLVALGLQHVPQEKKQHGPPDGTTAGNVLEFEDHHHSSVQHTVGALELPGMIGKDQSSRVKTLTPGNTPWTAEETLKLGESTTRATTTDAAHSGTTATATEAKPADAPAPAPTSAH